MKSIRILTLSTATMIAIGSAVLAAEPNAVPARAAEIEYPIGMDAFTRLDLLPLLPPTGTRMAHQLSYDQTAHNGDGFRLWPRYIDSNGQAVIYDAAGPGCLYRLQMNIWALGQFSKRPTPPGMRIRFYFDDEQTPRLDTTVDKLFGRDQRYTAPFLPPLAFFDEGFNANRNGGGHAWSGKDRFAILYHPFTFAKRLKITTDPLPPEEKKWYQFTGVVYPEGTPVTTWTPRMAEEATAPAAWTSLGQPPLKGREIERQSSETSLAAGETRELMRLDQAALVTSLQFSLQPFDADTFLGTTIRIRCDDLPEPTVEMPLGALVGAGCPPLKSSTSVWQKRFASLLIGWDPQAGTAFCHWPMPVWKEMRIEATAGKTPVRIGLQLERMPNRLPREASGYCTVRRTVDGPDDTALFATALRLKGRGKLAGIVFYSDNYNMDGDELTFLDGSKTAQVHGSGTEDDHNQGWGGDDYQKALWGGTINGYNGGYRFYLGDAYAFHGDILCTYEHSAMGKRNKQVLTDAICYTYLAPGGPRLVQSDAVRLGDPVGVQKHALTTSGVTWEGESDSSNDTYETGPNYGRSGGAIMAFTGEQRFRIAIKPANEGVTLRRTVDRNRIRMQIAELTVDGTVLGQRWITNFPMNPETLQNNAWADTDIFLPASLTRGKSELSISVRCIGSSDPKQGINALRYTAFCHTPPDLRGNKEEK